MTNEQKALAEVASRFSPEAQTAIMSETENRELEDEYPDDGDESTVAHARRACTSLEAFLESHAQGAPDHTLLESAREHLGRAVERRGMHASKVHFSIR